VYDDADFDQTLDLINTTSEYALTGAMCAHFPFFSASFYLVYFSFASERQALIQATNKLRHAAGNVYYNEKCTGAVVGQQPFGGGRASGTNDKAGSIAIFYRFVSMRSIKENFVGLEEFGYPSNLV
jgi:1-pyrroline-5-carboxylate dehydrogenase